MTPVYAILTQLIDRTDLAAEIVMMDVSRPS